jgi:hypothetical protein
MAHIVFKDHTSKLEEINRMRRKKLDGEGYRQALLGVSADADDTLVDKSRLGWVMQHPHQGCRIPRLVQAGPSAFLYPGPPESRAGNAHAYLVIKKAWCKVKRTRKKWEKVLPEANRGVAGGRRSRILNRIAVVVCQSWMADALVAQQRHPEPWNIGPYIRARHRTIICVVRIERTRCIIQPLPAKFKPLVHVPPAVRIVVAAQYGIVAFKVWRFRVIELIHES